MARPILTLKKHHSEQATQSQAKEMHRYPNNQAVIPINALKVTLPLSPEVIPRDILPPEGKTGKVGWRIEIENTNSSKAKPMIIHAFFSAKNYRRAIRTIDKHLNIGESVIVLLQGRLTGNRNIENAGLSVQVRKTKQEDMQEQDNVVHVQNMSATIDNSHQHNL